MFIEKVFSSWKIWATTSVAFIILFSVIFSFIFVRPLKVHAIKTFQALKRYCKYNQAVQSKSSDVISLSVEQISFMPLFTYKH